MHTQWTVVSQKAKAMFSFSYREYLVVSEDGLHSCGPFVRRGEAEKYARFLSDPSSAAEILAIPHTLQEYPQH
jgi:hypothetical protein